MHILCGDKRDVDKCDAILDKNNKITNQKWNNNNSSSNHKSGKTPNNKKSDKIDYGGGIDGRAAMATAAAAAATARSPNKRAQKIDGSGSGGTPTGESFTLPRVVLRQR